MTWIIEFFAMLAVLMPIPQSVLGAEDRALAYHRHSYRGDFEAAYRLLSPSERQRLSFEDFLGCPHSRRMGSDDTELIRTTDGGWLVIIGPKPAKPSGLAVHLPPSRVGFRVSWEHGTWHVTLPDCPVVTARTAR